MLSIDEIQNSFNKKYWHAYSVLWDSEYVSKILLTTWFGVASRQSFVFETGGWQVWVHRRTAVFSALVRNKFGRGSNVDLLLWSGHFGEGVVNSGVNFIIWPGFTITRSIPKQPSCCFKTDANIIELNFSSELKYASWSYASWICFPYCSIMW